MAEKTLKSLADGILKIGDVELDVSVLENGVRVVKQTDVFRALGRDPRGNSRIDQIPAFMDAKNLQSLISSDLEAMIKRVVYLDRNGKEKELGITQRELADRTKWKIEKNWTTVLG